jgi:hypothetical protein
MANRGGEGILEDLDHCVGPFADNEQGERR